MNRTPYFAWIFLAVWATWLCAFTGYLTQFAGMPRWAPQLELALFVAVAARIPVQDIGRLALVVGLARVAVSIDSSAAVLAAALSFGILMRVARSAFQLESPVIAGGLAGLLCVLQAAWLQIVHLHTQGALAAGSLSVSLSWRAALSTALVTALLGGVLAHLPGMGQLIRRKTWAVGASLR